MAEQGLFVPQLPAGLGRVAIARPVRYTATTFDFTTTITLFWQNNAGQDPAVAAFRVCARIAHRGEGFDEILTAAGIDLLTGQTITNADERTRQRQILAQEVLMMGVMVARFAGQMKGAGYPRLGSLAGSANSAARAWEVVKTTTPAEVLEQTIEMLASAFAPPSDVSLVNAARRLLGRGFTYLNLALELIQKLDVQQKATLGRLFSAYPEEITSFVDTLQWVMQNPGKYRYGFYTGIPENRGMKNYRHLAKIVDVVTSLPTMRNFAGGVRQLVLPAQVQAEAAA